MKLSQQSQSVIESAIKKSVNKYASNCDQTTVTDIHIQANPYSGELCVYDDDDDKLTNVIIDEWVNYENDDFFEDVELLFRSLLCRMKDTEELDKLTILKPYSFVLVDEEKETLAELLLIDDDTILIDSDLLKGLDKELNDFLKKLLEK